MSSSVNGSGKMGGSYKDEVERASTLPPPPADANDEDEAERAPTPPPTPTTPPPRKKSAIQRPSPLQSQSRMQSAESQISEITMAGSPSGYSWDRKQVADDIDQVSREDKEAAAVKKSGTPILTLSQVSKACPVEEEAQKLILKTLDEKKDKPKVGSYILPHVPDNSHAAFETGNENAAFSVPTSVPPVQTSVPSVHDTSATSSDPPVPPRRGFRKLNVIGLFHRKRTQEGQEVAPLVSTKPVSDQNVEGGKVSNEDALVHNAILLFRNSTGDSHELNGDIEQGSSHHLGPSSTGTASNHSRNVNRIRQQVRHSIRDDVAAFRSFIEPRKMSMTRIMKNVLVYLILPLVLVSVIFFYLAGNPELGNTGASVSWFLLFVIRNAITYILAKATSIYVINYLSLTRKVTVKVFGPVVALSIVQSNGYPSQSFFWGMWNIILLCGKGEFAKHWLFWQDFIDMCNANNPAGTITESGFYVSATGCAMIFGAAVALKRLWLGLLMAKRSYLKYYSKYETIQRDVDLIKKISAISVQPADALQSRAVDDNTSETSSTNSSGTDGGIRHYTDGGLTSDQQEIVLQHLEAWEEPADPISAPTAPTVSEILKFRQSSDCDDKQFPFSKDFGLADTREHCFESAQKEYYRLLVHQNSGNVLHFNTIAKVALNNDGTMDQEKMKELVRMFRPSRQGELSEIDFVKSIDTLYRCFRLLHASIDNSGSVSRAFEIIVNYAFFIILWCIMLAIVGIDPLALFVSLSSVIVGFSFAVGTAASSFFSGLLFILVRRPYDIGDRIAISNVEQDTNPDGSTTWFVEDLGLYTTTVRLAPTNEVATYSNGSLANSRVINANRSPQAIIAIYLKFPVGVSVEKIRLCRKTIQRFVKERPREFISLLSFRATTVEQDRGYVEYKLQLQHRESWQNFNAILNSKAEVTSFSLEVAKQLGMRYVAPPLPVDLKMHDSSKDSNDKVGVPSSTAAAGFAVSPEAGAQAKAAAK